ncbi:MAG: DODA-type extradiol aromatic ring-opening family dioxygenase, partial [Thermoleophilia bacterium]
MNTTRNDPEDRASIVYLSHGGGPLPILGDPGHKAMVDFMVELPARLKTPEAVLVISAHWEENSATLLGAPSPSMFYDYYGFPEKAYEITYPAPGSPVLASKIAGLLNSDGIPARIDAQRGFDHGLFIPLKLMYPQADIPSLQLSLVRGLDPAVHLALGGALRKLMHDNVLVIGSGFSFHNLAAFFRGAADVPDRANDGFQDWLIEVCTGPLFPSDREQRLVEWQEAPSARYCHPREEHLLPLLVCVGMAGGPGTLIFDDHIFGERA